MFRRTTQLLLTALACSVSVTWCFAQDRGRDSRERDSRTSVDSRSRTRNRSSHDFHQVSTLFGAGIRLNDDDWFGSIDDIFIDDTGAVVYVATSYDGEFLPIPFAALSLGYLDSGYVFLDVDRDVLLDAPRFNSLSVIATGSIRARVDTFFRDEARVRMRSNSSDRQNDDRFDRNDSRSRSTQDRDRRGDDRDRSDRDNDRFDRSRSGSRDESDRSGRSGFSRDSRTDRSYRTPERDTDSDRGSSRGTFDRDSRGTSDSSREMDRPTPGRSPGSRSGSSSQTNPGSSGSGYRYSPTRP